MDFCYYISPNVYKWAPSLFWRLWLAGSVPEYCQSQNVNKPLIGWWPVRIGLPPRPPSTHTKKRNNWPCGFKASRVRWWKGIRRGGFKAPQRRTPIGPEAIWVKRESMGILQRKGEIISWIFQIIGVSFPHKCGTVAADHYEKSWMQVKLEWMRAEEATRPVERRGSTAVERPRRGALSQETISEVRPGHCGKNERGGGGRADWFRLMWNLTSGETSSLCFGFEFRWGRKCLHGWRMQRTM